MIAKVKPMLIATEIIRSPLRKSHPEVDRIARLLEPPFEENHIPAHASTSGIIAADARKCAAVYKFDQNSYAAAAHMCRSSHAVEHVFECTKPPHQAMLMEFPYEDGSYWAILTEGDRNKCMMTYFDFDDGEPIIVQCTISFSGCEMVDEYENRFVVAPFLDEGEFTVLKSEAREKNEQLCNGIMKLRIYALQTCTGI